VQYTQISTPPPQERAKNADLDALFATNLTNAKIFDITKHGVNTWFQTRPAEPDVLLQDIVSVFLPSADIATHERYYLRNVSDPNDVSIDPAADACADATAATFTNYRQSACNSSTTLIPGLDRPIPSCEDKSERIFQATCAPTRAPSAAPTSSEPTSAPTSGAGSMSLGAVAVLAASLIATVAAL
jgi:hypothetical protein